MKPFSPSIFHATLKENESVGQFTSHAICETRSCRQPLTRRLVQACFPFFRQKSRCVSLWILTTNATAAGHTQRARGGEEGVKQKIQEMPSSRALPVAIGECGGRCGPCGWPDLICVSSGYDRVLNAHRIPNDEAIGMKRVPWTCAVRRSIDFGAVLHHGTTYSKLVASAVAFPASHPSQAAHIFYRGCICAKIVNGVTTYERVR